MYSFGGYNKPNWTPDGRIVVAGSSQKGLFISNAGFTGFDPIGTGLISPTQPDVSPDGSKVAFISNNHLHTINIDGTGKQQITTSDAKESMPVWSPDGKWIAVYVTSTPQSSIYLVPLEKSGTVNITNISSNFKPHLSLQYDWVH
jgi:TolB protein